MNRYKLSRSARADLDAIWLDLASRANFDIASRTVDEITDGFRILGAMPGVGRMRPELGAGILSFPLDDYIVYYRKDRRGGTQIIRVIHGRRDQSKALR